MQSIYVFSGKGGTGRTTLVMALASGFIALKKRVFVINATNDATLPTWLKTVRACGTGADKISLETTKDYIDYENALARAYSENFDVFLVDTPAISIGSNYQPPYNCDLLLAPFSNSFEAAIVAHGLTNIIPPQAPDRTKGVLVRTMRSPREVARDENAARHLFGISRMLDSELPHGAIATRLWKEGLLFPDNEDQDYQALAALTDEVNRSLQLLNTKTEAGIYDLA